jgi:hypothetical protein
MRDLRLVGVHEDGQHVLLSADDGTRFRLAIDDDLRAAARRDRPRLGQLQMDVGATRPRDVQALIRAGVTADEVAERTGWSVDKVRRYEGPILAEREHVAALAAGVRVRGRAAGGEAPTLATRVTERLAGRGVDPGSAQWDAHRTESGPWTVLVIFPAGGRERQASWHFDVPDRTITALDDEARWLSEDDEAPASGPIPAPRLPPTGRSTRVYDVEAEGGLRATERPNHGADEPVDLMTAMRERSGARGRRRSGGHRGTRKSPVDVPGVAGHAPDEALPLENIPFHSVTADLPPAAHADPEPDGPDGRPEPEARELLEREPSEARDTSAGGALPEEPVSQEPVSQQPAPEKSSTGAPGSENSLPLEPVSEDPESEELTGLVGELRQAPEDDRAVASAGAGQPADAEAPATEPGAEPTKGEPAADEAPVTEPGAEPSRGEPAAAEPTGAEAAEREPAATEPPASESETPARPRRSGRKGRPSVPSWDDVMFGSRPGAE